MGKPRPKKLVDLIAFIRAVRDERDCTYTDGPLPDDHVRDCWRCYAEQVLEPWERTGPPPLTREQEG